MSMASPGPATRSSPVVPVCIPLSAAGNPGYGVGLVLKEAKDGIPYEEILEYVPADHTYGIIGGFNDWNGDVAMEKTADNTWVGEVKLTAGTEFKVRADGAWDYSWGNGADNLVAEEDGTYEVTIVFNSADDVTVTAVKK